MIGDNSAGRLNSIVERIERIESDIKDMNSDKSEVYKEARGAGFDVKVLREVIKRRRMDANDLSEREILIDTYLAALGTPIATRARTSAIPHNPDTGEIIDLDKCPGCGGPADNGHDRCVPPNPYFCTKCHDAQEPEVTGQGRDSLSDNRTPNEIIGDMPPIIRRA